jgi:hypothetical protein
VGLVVIKIDARRARITLTTRGLIAASRKNVCQSAGLTHQHEPYYQRSSGDGTVDPADSSVDKVHNFSSLAMDYTEPRFSWLFQFGEHS